MSSFRSVLLLSLGLSVCFAASAGLAVTPGNTEQKKCGASRSTSLARMGNYVRGGARLTVDDRRLSVGRPLNPGEVVFYASLSETKKVYRTGKQIEIIDGSPLTPDIKISTADVLPVTGTFTAESGRRFDLIDIGTGYNRFTAMVNEQGFICSERLDEQLVAVGAPTTYQEMPLTVAADEPGLIKPKTRSVAVTFLGASGASASFEITVMVNGVVEAQKASSVDAFSPSVKMGALTFTMKINDGKLLVTSLDEPSDFGQWLNELRVGHRR